MKIRHAILFIFLFIMAFSVFAQDKTMYFMGIHPNSNEMNPAIQYNRSLVILNPSLNASFSNSSLTFNKTFTRGTGTQDSLLFWDFSTMGKNLRNTNYIHANISNNLLFAGKKIKNGFYATFGISNKNSIYFTFPKTFVDLRYGNADLANNKPRTIDLNNYSFNGFMYREYSFGLSKAFSEKFSLGIHLKLLRGNVAARTTKFLASIETSDDFSESLLKTDISVNLSAPVLNTEKGDSSINFDMASLKDQMLWPYISLKNYGAAIDLGFTYNINKKLTVSGSINDLGFINWGAKPQRLSSKGEYLFDGLYFSPENLEGIDTKGYFKDYFKVYTDTINSIFLPKESGVPFKTWLFAKSYFAITYKHNKKISFSTLLKSTFFYDILLVEATAGTTYSPNKTWAFTGTWSYSNYSLYNFGLGILINGKKGQFYAVTDNINSFDTLNSKSVNFVVGLNMFLFQDNKLDNNSRNSFLR